MKIRLLVVIGFLLIGWSLFGCATPTTVGYAQNTTMTSFSPSSSPAKAEQKDFVAERPILLAGDYWMYRYTDGISRTTFIGEQNGLLLFQVGSRKDCLLLSNNLAPIQRTNGKTGEVTFKSPLPGGILGLEFPLKEGKSLRFSYEVASQNSPGMMVPLDVTVKVTGIKNILLESGEELQCFVLRRYWQARGYTDSGSEYFYYSPKAKAIVKDGNRELVEYHIQ